MLAAAVLAAGRSLRMGRPKALLPCAPGAQDTFVARIVGAIQAAGVPGPLVVGRPDDRHLADVVSTLQPARFIANPNHAQGQLTSIVAALDALGGTNLEGLLVMPVDMPSVTVDTFAAILHAAAANPGRIVRACHAGRHGHPVVFDRGSFDGLRAADPSIGAKSVLRARPERVLDVDTPDPGVLQDVDTLDDYVAAFGHVPGSGSRT